MVAGWNVAADAGFRRPCGYRSRPTIRGVGNAQWDPNQMSEQPPADADSALRLRVLVAGGPITEEAPELIRLADLAATKVADAALREKLAESLIAALTVIRFAPLFGTDPRAAKAETILAALAAVPSA